METHATSSGQAKTQTKERIEKLRKTIDRHRYLYHVLDKPEISDAALDSLKKELFDLEQKYPELITPDSPTQRIGGEPLKQFKKFEHPQMMLSFNDAFGEQDMKDWYERNGRALGRKDSLGSFYCELKIDGLSMELVYRDGLLEIGATRGDGKIGEDVTQNFRTVEPIPLSLIDVVEIVKNLRQEGFKELATKLEKKGLPKELVIRGEVFMSKKEFANVNKFQEKSGEKTYANPRNLAAGSIRQLDSKVTAARKLDSYAYSLITDLGQTLHEDEHKILKAFGFKINPHNKLCKDLKEVQEFRDYWEEHRGKLDYEIDGIVVLVNDNKVFEKLGVVGKAPRAGIAYKFAPVEATTIVEDIVVGVGRTGTLTPVAVLRPVHIGGVTVSRATLHNEDEIKRLGIKIGDTVIVGRAGDVIPDVKKVLTDLRTGKEKFFHFPKKCPVCGGQVKRLEGQAAYKCTNTDCPAIKREGIYHFISRGAINIDGIGPKIIDQLMDAGLISDAADLYSLEKEDLLNLDRFADKSATNAVESVQSRKKITLDKFVYALGIPNVGSETAFDLAREFGSLEKIQDASLEKLNSVRDIGDVVAQSIYDWFRSKYNLKLLEKFKKAGVVVEKTKLQKSTKLGGKTFVLTGTLESLTRESAEELIRQNGGDVSTSVSSQTDYVVAGTEPGSKYDKAVKFGIKILSEKEFLKMID